MDEKKYLTLPKKIAYAMDDSAWCFISLLVSTFMMIYLTDTVGLNPAVIGSLMMAAKLFDGVSDLIFGYILDRTHTKMGKARPWMLWSMFGCAIGLVALFGIPESLGDTAKYAWFFIFYMLVNTVFYTSGYISYSTLMSLITRNRQEQLQITSYRTIAGNLSYMLLGSITFALVTVFGGGAAGWRTLGIVYAVIGIAINLIAVFSNQELPEEEDIQDGAEVYEEKSNMKETLKSILTCRYFYGVILIMLCLYLFATVFQTAGAYYATYVLGNENMMGTLSVVNYGVTMTVAFIVPLLAKRIDVQKLSILGLCVGVAGRLVCLFGGAQNQMGIVLFGLAIAAIATAVIQTTSYTMMSSTCEYLWRKDHIRANGVIFSCSSMGIKLGGGLGTAISGFLLSAGGYVANAAQQPQSAINMLNFMFLWIPLIITIIIIAVLFFMDVDKKLDQMSTKKETVTNL